MKRAKPPKKHAAAAIKAEIRETAVKYINQERDKIKQECMDEIMDLIMPVVMLACKDELRLNQGKLDAVSRRADRYFEHIADGSVSIDQLHELMEVKDVR